MGETHQVQSQLEQRTQQMMRVVQGFNEEKDLIEDKFVMVKSDLEIPEGRILTEKVRLDGEVSGVGGQVMIQQAITDEV